ncbi:RNA polymerase sigma factor RpoD/SigA [Mucilaginibacter sp. RS28]|uniref:RNA polymerase sigma factor RpoD/SigA n=1 Tax=Mucilaginibacter straminoryzae TaxID=2932774 RepID=A0A9X1X1E5_9SPHI|nr:RNA polymerase sigma factor RpoD/SigA [Mucilaginibacter straminoryzae]MCJ8208225.1 RNA polymerase sigma factor RpoD/SigA [Mucilaginibacter straminoryzae]
MRNIQITERITTVESHVVERYFNEINKVRLISGDEEVMLARKIKAGDRAALEKLVKSNLRFVISVAKKYQNKGLTLSDLISEGNSGLLKAAERFDETKGFKFISFAVWWIRQAITFAIAEQTRMIRLPANQINTLTSINRCKTTFEQLTGREPELFEIAEELHLKEDKLRSLLRNSGRTDSYDMPYGTDQKQSLIDVLPCTDHLIERQIVECDRHTELHKLLDQLTPREKEVIELTFGLGERAAMQPDQVGEMLGITAERVRQLRSNALKRLRTLTSTRRSFFWEN